MKILHISDIHLGREFSSNNIVGEDFSIRREEIWDSFENSLLYAKENKVEIILISGDLYENSSITKSNLDRLAFIFKKYSELRFYIALGNHDHISNKSNYLKEIAPKNVFIFDDKLEYKEYKKVRIYGYSWSKVEYNYCPLNFNDLDNNFYNILLIHGMDSRVSNYFPLDIKYLEGLGFNYIALGHIHEPKKIGQVSYYAGAIEPLSFNNLGPHGGLLISVEDQIKIDFLEFAKRNYTISEIDISQIENNRALFSQVYKILENSKKADYKKLIFIGKKKKSIDLSELDYILARDYKNVVIEDLTRPNVDFSYILENNRDNIIGKYFEYVFNNFDEKDQRLLVDIGLNTFPLGEDYEN